MGTPSDHSNDTPLVTLGLNLTRSCKYVHENQGLGIKDILFVLHGIMGQVLSWDEKDEETEDGEDEPTDEIDQGGDKDDD